MRNNLGFRLKNILVLRCFAVKAQDSYADKVIGTRYKFEGSVASCGDSAKRSWGSDFEETLSMIFTSLTRGFRLSNQEALKGGVCFKLVLL